MASRVEGMDEFGKFSRFFDTVTDATASERGEAWLECKTAAARNAHVTEFGFRWSPFTKLPYVGLISIHRYVDGGT